MKAALIALAAVLVMLHPVAAMTVLAVTAAAGAAFCVLIARRRPSCSCPHLRVT